MGGSYFCLSPFKSWLLKTSELTADRLGRYLILAKKSGITNCVSFSFIFSAFPSCNDQKWQSEIVQAERQNYIVWKFLLMILLLESNNFYYLFDMVFFAYWDLNRTLLISIWSDFCVYFGLNRHKALCQLTVTSNY